MHYLIYGANAVDVDDRVSSILAELDPSGVATSRLDAPAVQIEDLVAAVNVPPFFGSSRLVVVRGLFDSGRSAPRSSEGAGDEGDRSSGRGVTWDQAEPVILGAPPTTAVIIRQDGEIRSNSRALKQAKSQGWTIERYPLLYGRELVAWAEQRATREGVTFAKASVPGLLDRLFPGVWQAAPRGPQELTVNMRLLATEIAKLACAADDGVIGNQTIAELVADRSGFTAFKLNDDTFEGRTAAALEELDNVLAAGEVPEKVLGQLAHQATAFNAASAAAEYGQEAVAQASGVSAGQLGLTISRKSGWRNRPAVRRAAESLRRGEWLVKTGRIRRTESVIVPVVGEIAESFRQGQASPRRKR